MAAGPHEPDEPGEKSAGPHDTGSGSEPVDPGPDPSEGAGPVPDDIEARWKQIVADLGDLDVEGATEPFDDGTDEPVDGSTSVPVLLAEPTEPRSWRPDPAVEEAENHFVPPDPGPVLGGDPLLTMAWAAAVGVPVLLIVVAVVWRDVPMSWLAAAGAVFLAGVGLLLWRMPHGDDDDPNDNDPGAVV